MRSQNRPTSWHATGALFAKQIEPEPAPEDPVDWAMADTSDDEDDAAMPDETLDLELVDTPPAPASAPPMSRLVRCIAFRLVYGAGPRQCLPKMPPASHLNVSLCCLTCRVSRVSWPALVCPRPDHQSQSSQTVTQKRVFRLYHRFCSETRTKESDMNARFSGVSQDTDHVKSTSPTTENGYENCIYSMNNIHTSDEDNKHDTNYINKHKYTNHDTRKLHL